MCVTPDDDSPGVEEPPRLSPGVSSLAPQDIHGCFRPIRVLRLSLKEKKILVLHSFFGRVSRNRIRGGRGVVCSLDSILWANPLARRVSEPWFCAAVPGQVGVCAHFIHQFSGTWQTPGVRLGTGNAGSARILYGAAVPGRARGARVVFQPVKALILLCRRNCALPRVGAQQTATSGLCARYFSGFLNNLMAPVGIDCRL